MLELPAMELLADSQLTPLHFPVGLSPVGVSAFTGSEGSFTGSMANAVTVEGRHERIVGTAEADWIDASKGGGRNEILGKGSGDRLLVNKKDIAKGQNGDDYLDAQQGRSNNRLKGGKGDDILLGRKGDRLFGNSGDDLLNSLNGRANNILDGGTGNDVLYAGRKSDVLAGGGGADQFWLALGALPLQPHRVTDFQPGRDRLGFDSIAGLTHGSDLTLAASGADTIIQFQGRAIATLESTAPKEIRNDNVLIILPGTSPAPAHPGEGNGSEPPIVPAPETPLLLPGPSSPEDADGGEARDDRPLDHGGELPEENNPTEGHPIFATYRKDYFFPDDVYDEDTPEPLTGGRIQIAAIAQVTGRVNNVFIEGVERRVMFEKNPDTPSPFEWVHVWPQQAKAGDPIWVNFHSRDARWDTLDRASIQVETRNGMAVDGHFPVAQTPVPLTYVTTTDDYSRLLIHAKNTDTVAHRVAHLWVNGVDVLANASLQDAATGHSGAELGESLQPDRILAANTHALWEIPLAKPTAPGNAWTVVVEYENAPPAVGTGRVVPEFFPVMAWNNTSERPFPSGELENYLNIRRAGIDTMLINDRTCHEGACDPYMLINDELPILEGFGAVVNYQPFVAPGRDFPEFTDTSGIVAVMTGDESDDAIYTDDGVPIPAIKARESWRSWQRYPELPTFNGAKTNKLVGSFAGMADIQGIDFYTAAGAPHITAFGDHPPLRATFDYLRNTRNNHMPLTTWMYTQGLSPVWNRRPLLGGDEFSVQPDPQEILAQGMMAIAAGAKGLAWFQVNQEEARKAPERWRAIADVNSMVRAVRPWLREGDVTGAARSDADTLVELIRAPDALIVPIISLDTVEEPTDLGFILAQSEAGIPRWIFDDATPDVSVTIPPGFDVADVFEVQPEGIADIQATFSRPSARRQTALFEDIPLDNETPVRLLVLASNDTVRADISATLS